MRTIRVYPTLRYVQLISPKTFLFQRINTADVCYSSYLQLVKEQNTLAKFYNNQSVAEQNSVDLAWNLLMDESFKNLRACIYGTEEEMRRFRQLVVNSVMATDIVDKELKALRNARWEKAFSETATKDENERDTINRKATIVIEHLIQASDVAHTMQHWHIYRKWNERFFMECFAAFQAGRAESNPADNWYKGELGFFDFYIVSSLVRVRLCLSRCNYRVRRTNHCICASDSPCQETQGMWCLWRSL